MLQAAGGSLRLGRDDSQTTTFLAVLRRLAPYVRPVRGRLMGSGAAALGAMLAGLGIPLLIQRIIDGPVAHRDRATLVWLSLGVLGLGSRAISNLTTIRRFVAFSGIFLVVNVLTVLVGLIVLLVIAPSLGMLARVMAAPLVVLCRRDERRSELAARCAQDQRRVVVMVTQESFLFAGSVADNIALGAGRPASRSDVVAAARAVGADEFITALPEGYYTDVHKRGARLSAGQRQLVSFARALLADPAVLVLAEATSSLDIPSEQAVQAALATVLSGRTALIIAHRLSTVLAADRVLVLADGLVIEDGSPAELITGTGAFATLHTAEHTALA